MKNKLIAVAILAAVALAFGLWKTVSKAEIGLEKTRIDETANQIAEIKAIGQWEFLSVDCEVLVDSTIRRHFPFSDKELARIYRGTVRIGVDLASAPEGWFENIGDTLAVISLPKIGVLDSRFIDEAATTTFYESGKWSASAKEQMYVRAKEQMLAFALTPSNLKMATEQAEVRFAALFRAMGFRTVEVRWQNGAKETTNEHKSIVGPRHAAASPGRR